MSYSSQLADQLSQIEGLIGRANPGEAETRLRALLFAMGREEAATWEADLRKTIDSFLPRRRRVLGALLANKLGQDALAQPAVAAPIDLVQLEDDVADELAELSSLHIFQWSTFYRDFCSRLFDRALALPTTKEDAEAICRIAHRALVSHAAEIFTKGFVHQISVQGHTTELAIAKGRGGLGRFLELPLEGYSARVFAKTLDFQEAIRIRHLTSTLLLAIIEGFGDATLGSDSGWRVLRDHPRSWLAAAAFLETVHVEGLLDRLGPSTLKDELRSTVLPLLGALDDIARSGHGPAVLPALGQLLWDIRRLDVSLRQPSQTDASAFLDVQCFLESGSVSRLTLQEAASRNVALIVVPFRSDLHEWVASNAFLSESVIFVEPAVAESPRQRIQKALAYAIFKRRSRIEANAPLTYNFAREFPLQNPALGRYFHVQRTSVRELLHTLESRNGARLWCSVRRSGKTTACFDLASTTGLCRVVSQTCGATHPQPEATVFYDRVTEALSQRTAISRSFFRDIVEQSAASGTEGERYVFVLDEYETLFGRLKIAAERDPELRYLVAQALIDQMVVFSRENLLVFLGQQPDAHFILMDQNQLSPYVLQDSFPLFRYASEGRDAEFTELLGKVLSERVSFDAGFARKVYQETAGHPFLTVNVLVALVDWLIEEQRPIGGLRLTEGDFDSFKRSKLAPNAIRLSREYSFFREAARDAMSGRGRSQSPWLFSIYSVLKEICRNSPETLACSRGDFSELVTRLRTDELGFSADDLLRSGAQANFIAYSADTVGPAINLLGRIAAVAAAAT